LTKKLTLVTTLIIAAIAVLFPPWGFRGQTFGQFAFLFSNSVMIDFGAVSAQIVWHVLALELVAIGFVGAVAYVLARK